MTKSHKIYQMEIEPCSCGGPWTVPDDAEIVQPNIIRTCDPNAVHQIHAKGCDKRRCDELDWDD